MNIDSQEKVQQSTKEVAPMAYKHVCGFCGSTQPLVSYEVMYGPGAIGWDCCPDCGGV